MTARMGLKSADPQAQTANKALLMRLANSADMLDLKDQLLITLSSMADDRALPSLLPKKPGALFL